MSLFSKVLARAAAPGLPVVPSARPKGIGALLRRDSLEEEDTQPLRRMEPQEDEMQTLRRSEMEEEEDAQALRRTDIGEEDEAQPLRRSEEEEEDMQPLRRSGMEEDEEQAQALRRTKLAKTGPGETGPGEEEEDMQPLRRNEAEEEEDAQALRRSEMEEEEEAQPLRRSEMEEEEEAQALRRDPLGEEEEDAQPLRRAQEDEEADMQALRRMADPPRNDEPAARMEDPEFPKEPSNAMALRRSDTAAAPAAVSADPGAGSPDFRSFETENRFDMGQIPPAVPLSERPRVHIDQIDVTIHEPASATGRSSPDTGAALSRMLSGRYLRGG